MWSSHVASVERTQAAPDKAAAPISDGANVTDMAISAITALVQRAASTLAETNESAAEAHDHEEFEALSLGVLFTTMLIFLGGTFFMTHRDRIPLPYTVVLFLYGIVVGAIAKLIAPGVASALGEIPPELLFYIFLPVLIFEGSFAMNVHALKRVFGQTLLLATAGILINTAILGSAVKLFYSDWSWYTAMLLGSLLSATDPVAVVALLKSLRVEKHITAMVDGEAVMNDGTAIIVFTLLLPAAKYGGMTDPAWLIVLNCIRLSVLPVFIGPAFGFVQSFWLRRAKDGLTRACVTVSVTYVSYYVAAHWIGASGVLTLFFQGVFLSYYCPSLFPGVEDGNLISSTWEFLVHLGNTVLFSLVGVILVADVVHTIEIADIFIIIALYVAMLLARLVMLEILLPVMNRFSYKMTQKTVLLLTHAGLRGGVAATLALAVQQGDLKEGIPILKITCGVVLLTLLVNATTAAKVVGRLGFKSKDEYRVRQVQSAMDNLYYTEEKALERVKRDTKYRNANWISVEKYVNKWLRNPFTGQEILPDVDHDTVINRLLMTAFKTALWRQRDEQVISETVVMQLGQMLAEKIEKGELFNISEMQLYHRERRDGGGGGGAASDVVVGPPESSTARGQHPHHRSGMRTPRAASVAASGTPATRAVTTTTTTPRTHSVVVDTHPQSRSGRVEQHEDDEELPLASSSSSAVAVGGGRRSPLGAGTTVSAGAASTFTRQSSWDAGVVGESSSPLAPGSPSFLPEAPSEGLQEEDADAMVESLMGRLLPTWVVLAERFIFGKGYFVSAHRRTQENAFMTLLAVVKCLSVMSEHKYQFVKTPEQARRVERWFSRQLRDGNAAIRFFYNHFPEATNTVSSSRAVISIVNELHEAIEDLHAEEGVGVRVKEMLEGMTNDMRENIPERWQNDEPTKEADLVTQAVAATTLGKGLRKAEIRAIATMALVKNFSEYDIITLPENAFLIVVFGSLRALHSRWTTISQDEWVESFGDTVGLETFLLPAELCKDRQRQWQVISTEATALMISFNSIKPFLSERSLRSVKALWRAAAVEVVLPFLETMVTTQAFKAENAREHLTNIVMQGTPLIGPEECARFDYSSQFHLCFYLRGSDVTGMFNGHTPPCYISALYANQLVWRDPEVVLYAVPMNISDSGYVPWNLRTGTAHGASAIPAPENGTARDEEDKAATESISSHSRDDAEKATREVEVVDTAIDVAAEASRSTYADAENILSFILQGVVPTEIELSSTRRAHRSVVSPSVMNRGVNKDSPSRSGLSRIASEFCIGRHSAASLSGQSFLATGSTHSVSLHPHPEDSLEEGDIASPTLCVLQDLSAFVTPIPYVNLLFARYAAQLELLCMAALRYMRYPDDALHVRHAQRTAEATLEFLLSFAVELTLVRRAHKTILRTRAAAADAQAPVKTAAELEQERAGEEVDADFQCHVCAWSRQAAATKKHHLKTLILEMNNFANRRFRRYVSALKEAVAMEPRLANVESVEGMQKLLRSLGK